MADTVNKAADAGDANDFHPECDDLKKMYPKCFAKTVTDNYMNIHYNDYDDTCRRVFSIYHSCVAVRICLLMALVHLFYFLS